MKKPILMLVISLFALNSFAASPDCEKAIQKLSDHAFNAGEYSGATKELISLIEKKWIAPKSSQNMALIEQMVEKHIKATKEAELYHQDAVDAVLSVCK